jgi:GNAT superfamily N-acetyltransferase
MLDGWVHGWAISRNTPAPVKLAVGYRIDVGLTGHAVRYVLPAYDADVVDREHEPDTWLKIRGVVSLDRRWQVQAPEYLMYTALTPASVAVTKPYTLDTARQGSTIQVFARTGDGSIAARGKAALTGTSAVFDQIETDPQHRRRGLGRVVMGALSEAAQYAGATTGVLVATEDGRALYTALGWTLDSPITAAVNRG